MSFPSPAQSWAMLRTAARRAARALLGRPRSATLAVGTAAPAFAARTQDGRELRLPDLRGSYVVLWFFPKAGTFNCTREGCGFRDLANGFRERGAIVLGVSFDRPEENAAFAREQRFPFALLSDSDRAIALAFGACDGPSDAFPRRITYLIDRDGRIARVWPSMNVTSHAAEVLEAIPR